jgi:hypothetical protein
VEKKGSAKVQQNLTLLLPAAKVESFSRSGLLLDGKAGGTHLK